MSDFETEVSIKYPYKSNKDSDNGSYFNVNEAHDNWFNAQDESADNSGDDWE